MTADQKNNNSQKPKPDGRGRPSFQATKFYITLTKDQIDWLKSRGNASKQIRDLINREMQAEQK
jgi:hypothetical protein